MKTAPFCEGAARNETKHDDHEAANTVSVSFLQVDTPHRLASLPPREVHEPLAHDKLILRLSRRRSLRRDPLRLAERFKRGPVKEPRP